MSPSLSSSSTSFSTLVDLLQKRALEDPHRKIFTFLTDGEGEERAFSALELDRKARAIASMLQHSGRKGDRGRALLLYPPGLDYIAAFFGCLYAGVVAVPAYPPDPNRLSRTLPRLQAIIRDAEAETVLTTETILSMTELIFSQATDLKSLRWLATDTVPEGEAEGWIEPSLSAEDLAFLQYTSGSTGTPKGVMLSHGNLLHNLHLIQLAFEVTPESVGVIWLPPYHDMGLIGGILGTLYSKNTTILMSPLDFLQRPLRWLQAITRYRATISGGPNFAYDLCVRKTTPEQRKGLDLSSWSLAFNGAEPVRMETLERFAEAFKSCGFDRKAFYPCYGLAEGTLIVSGGKKSAPLAVKRILKGSLEKNRVVEATDSVEETKTFVGCGRALLDQEIRIIDPLTLKPCTSGEVGEIWVAGPSIAQGYWRRKEETNQTFPSFGPNQNPFLRTGDLGFLDAGDLFVTGRLKDLLIIRGRNHYPQDLELTAEKSHPILRAGCGAAFSIEEGDEERLVIVHEVESRLPGPVELELEEALEALRRTVAQEHDLEIFEAILLKRGEIPKTSSGKISRWACREDYYKDRFDPLKSWRKNIQASLPSFQEPKAPSKSNDLKDRKAIETWLIHQLSDRLGLGPEQVDPSKPLASYGLDSKDAVNLSGDLEDWLGKALSPTLLWKFPNIQALALHLSEEEQT